MENQRKKGSVYEQKAAHFLTKIGYRILQMNYHCRFGEVDIIAMDQNFLVFVEVKYRKSKEYGFPIEAVDYKKKKTISKVAQYYLMCTYTKEEIAVRFDVVSILGEQIEVYKHAFELIG